MKRLIYLTVLLLAATNAHAAVGIVYSPEIKGVAVSFPVTGLEGRRLGVEWNLDNSGAMAAIAWERERRWHRGNEDKVYVAHRIFFTERLKGVYNLLVGARTEWFSYIWLDAAMGARFSPLQPTVRIGVTLRR